MLVSELSAPPVNCHSWFPAQTATQDLFDDLFEPQQPGQKTIGDKTTPPEKDTFARAKQESPGHNELSEEAVKDLDSDPNDPLFEMEDVNSTAPPLPLSRATHFKSIQTRH